MNQSSSKTIFSPRRAVGRTGFVATVLGIGDLADRNVPLDECVATVHRAMDVGLNLIDTAPGYEDGYSEQVVGKALKGRRDGMFVIDKIDHMDQSVEPQIDASLQRLELDHTDLFVFHAVSTLEQWHKLAAPGGPMVELERCIDKGKTRFRGMSSHHPAVLVEAIESGTCDVVMFPIGPVVDPGYVQRVLPLAKKRGVGTVCFKTFGAGKLLGDTTGYNRPLDTRQLRPRGKLSSGGISGDGGGDGATLLPRLTVEECVRYTLTLDPDVALLGLSFPNEQDEAFRAAAAFRPYTEAQMADVRARAAEAIEGKGGTHWNPPA